MPGKRGGEYGGKSVSVLINMEMPTSCADCKVRLAVRCCGNLPHNTRMPNCPLGSVPPHGDLIEKHDVFKLISSFSGVDKMLPVEFMKALYNLPTIIPAEDGDGEWNLNLARFAGAISNDERE